MKVFFYSPFNDTGQDDGHTALLIRLLMASNTPGMGMKPHSVSGRWNENSLINISQDVPILVHLESVNLKCNKRRIPPNMTSFVCLFNSPRAMRSLRLPRSPRTTGVCGASHLTNGVTESRKITGYSLSSCDNILDKSRTSYCLSLIHI